MRPGQISGWPRTRHGRVQVDVTLPIHGPVVELADVEEMLDAAHDERLNSLWGQLHMIPEPSCSETAASTLTVEDIRVMLKNGIIRRSAAKFATAVAFSVAELAKGRRRFILWPKNFNNDFDYEPQVDLKTVATVIAEVQNWRHERLAARVFDAKAAFFQLRCPLEFQRHLVFSVHGEMYEMTRMPMGATVTPEIQQRLSVSLAQWAVNEVPPELGSVIYTVHIDNFRFLGSTEAVRMAGDKFIARCRKFNVTLNPEDLPGDFLGIHFNYEDRSVALTSKFVNKLKAVQSSSESGVPRSMTISEFETLFGRLMFAAEVLQLPLYKWYYAIKFYRKFCSKMSKERQPDDTPILLWKAAHEQLCEWFACAIQNVRRYPVDSDSNNGGVLFTDASDAGFGMVFIRGGTVIARGCKWSESRFWRDEQFLPSINQRELFAVMEGAEWLISLGVQIKDIHLRIDNVAALSSIRKRRSNSFFLNKRLQQAGLRWASISYVSSEDNLADEPSRNFAPRRDQDSESHDTQRTTASPEGLLGEERKLRLKSKELYPTAVDSVCCAGVDGDLVSVSGL